MIYGPDGAFERVSRSPRLQPADLDEVEAFLTVDGEPEASGTAYDEALRIARHLLGGT